MGYKRGGRAVCRCFAGFEMRGKCRRDLIWRTNAPKHPNQCGVQANPRRFVRGKPANSTPKTTPYSNENCRVDNERNDAELKIFSMGN